MTIRRGTLYTGVFLLSAGAVTLANVAGMLDPAAVADVLGALWPIAIIGIGVALVLRRSPAALVAGAVAAALPGLALGASLVAAAALPASFSTIPCTDASYPTAPAEIREGAFSGDATVRLELDCGRVAVATAPGTTWQVETRDGWNRVTSVSADSGRLEVGPAPRADRARLGSGRVDWDVTLPADARLDLTTIVNAGRGELMLGGAQLGSLGLVVNAGDLHVDLTGSTLDRLDLEVSAGHATVTLPAASFGGDIEASAGSVQLCTPDGLGLRVTSTASLGSVQLGEVVQHDGAWETPGYATAPFKADLAVTASLGNVTINPEGGCK